MDRKQIDELIIEAGLEEIISVFNSAIEIGYGTKDLPLRGEEDGYRVLARLIETALSNQWVDVNDRLPTDEFNYWYRVKLDDGSIEFAYATWRKWEQPPELKWQCPCAVGDDEGLSIEYFDNVTHWQPLLEPKEEK